MGREDKENVNFKGTSHLQRYYQTENCITFLKWQRSLNTGDFGFVIDKKMNNRRSTHFEDWIILIIWFEF